MKRTRITMVIALLVALSLTGCGSAMKQARADTMEADAGEQSLEEALRERYPFQDFPADAYPAESQTAKDGKVTPTEIETDLFQAKFEGDEVSGSGGAVGGAFHFIGEKTDGEAWHVKLECNYPTVAGRDYFVTYNFTSDVAGTVKFGDFQEFQIQQGENSVTGIFTAKEGTSYLDLQLGMLQPFTIDFTKVEVKEYADDVEYENALPAPVNFERVSRVFEKHDEGYSTYLARAKHAVNVNYVSSNLDSGVWKSRLYVRTGMVPEPGTHYRVMADVMSDQDMPFEVLINDGEVEKGYGALYGKELTANEVTVCEAVITGNGNGDELILQFSLGEAPEDAKVTVGNVRVDKIVDHYTNQLPVGYAPDKSVATGKIIDELVPIAYSGNLLKAFSYTSKDTVYEMHDDGYIVKLTEGKASAKMDIIKAPANPDDRGVWKAKLYAATGLQLKPGTSYLVKFDLESARDQADYEVCFDGDNENAYGALYGRSLTAGGTDHIETLITPEQSGGPLTIRVQLGKTNTSKGNTITFKNFSVETVSISHKNILPASFSYKTPKQTKPKYEYKSVLPDDFSYDTFFNVWEEHADSVEQAVSSDGSSATLNITQGRNGGGLWSSKLFIATGVTPEAGKRYRVKTTFTSDKAIDGFEALYRNGRGEANYEGSYELSAAAGKPLTITQDFTAPESGCNELVLLYQLGNSPAGNTITVSDIEIVPVVENSTSVLTDAFKYPVTTGSTHVDEFSAEQPLSLSASGVFWEGSAGSVSNTDSTATLKITQPCARDGIWNIRLHANTGVKLEQDVKYKVSGKLKSDVALEGVQVLYSNGDEETDFNPDGKGYMDGTYGLSVNADGTPFAETFTVPKRSKYQPLVLRVQAGNSPAPNTITLSDIKVEKVVPAHDEPGTTERNSFSFFAHADYSATMVGDGESATAQIASSPENRDAWQIKLYANTNVTLSAGKSYRISADVSATADTPYEICYNDGDNEKGVAVKDGLTATSSASTVVQNVTPETDQNLTIQFNFGKAASGTDVKVSGIRIEEITKTEGDNLMTDELIAWAPVHQWIDDGYAASLSNNNSSATMTFTSVADEQADWKAKLFVETGAELKKGKRYRIRYNIEADKNFDFNVFYNNGAEEKAVGEFYELNTSSKTIEHEVSPSSDAVLNIQLMLGKTNAPNKVTVSNVQVDEIVGGEGSDDATPINAWTHEDYKTSLSNTSSSATIAIEKAPSTGREPWKVKLFAETGAELKAGKTYRASFDVKSNKALPFEVCYNNREVEKAFGERFGLEASSTKQTVTYTINPDQDGVLFLQLNLGNATSGTNVTISNVKVEELVYGSTENAIPNFRCDSVGYLSSAADDGYITSFEQKKSSATFRIKHAPSERHAWNAKIIVRTGVTPKSGKGYRVSFDLNAAKKQNLFELFCDGNEELAYGALYEQQLSAGKNKISYIIMPGDSKGELTLQLRFGETDSKNGNTYTVSNFKVEEVTFAKQRRPEIKEVCELATQPGYTATLTKSPDSAMVQIVDTPETEMEAWKNKLFVYTGVVFEPGQKYRVSFNVKSIVPTPFEVCFNKSDEEKGIGGIFGLTSKPYGEFVEFTTYAKEDAPLVIQLSLGNVVAPNTIYLSDVKVEKAGEINLVSDTIYTF